MVVSLDRSELRELREVRKPIGLYYVDFSQEPAEPATIIPHLVASGHRILLAADEGQGKSFYVGYLALSVENGLNGATRGGVLVIDAQNGERRLVRRYNKLAAGMGATKFPTVIDSGRTPTSIMTDFGLLQIREAARSVDDECELKLIVFDARDDFVNEAEVNEANTATKFWRGMDELLDEFDRRPAILIAVNLRKLQGGQNAPGLNFPTQRVSGHKRFTDLADTVLSIEADRVPGSRTIAGVKVWPAKDRDDFVQSVYYQLSGGAEDDHLNFVNADEPDRRRPAKPLKIDIAKRELIDLLNGTTEVERWSELLKKLTASPNLAKEARDAIAAEGLIECSGKKGMPLFVRWIGGADDSPAPPAQTD